LPDSLSQLVLSVTPQTEVAPSAIIRGEALAADLEGAFALEDVRIKVRVDGPYLVQGPAILEDADGNQFEVPAGAFPLCRCGGSSNKPFCDGTHQKTGFKAETKAK
jgi:CDGSH-type Zn-finger protein